ncbi:alpha/beta fold hydrolase [Nocardioides humi]|uniref:Alpha/beta fold hydrolase n=1 Tax=Nocardioides humi TaxID=449461 RepID=A0ABN2BQF8_9ACTN|nr:alpha/beta fold hydrolase [Nocardioides humi]
MSHFVLVHGAWHGPWCWQPLEAVLRGMGHTTEAVELHGDDAGSTGAAARLTLDASAGRVVAAVRRGADGGSRTRPILVAHSMGGLAATQAAALVADELAALVYVCAFVPGPGESMLDLSATGFETSAVRDCRVVDERNGCSAILREGAVEAFYGCCEPKAAAWAQERLRPESLLVETQPVTAPSVSGRVPRFYVECTRDRAIPLAKQRSMHRGFAPEHVLTLDTDHSPFLSRPVELAGLLDRVSGDPVGGQLPPPGGDLS